MTSNVSNNKENSCDFDQILLPVEEAIQTLALNAKPIKKIETLLLSEALGRVLANDVVSKIDVPPNDNSAMDGYAINSSDLNQGVNQFTVSQRIPAGHWGKPLEKNCAARIFTGAPIPENADVVVMQEACERKNNKVIINNKYNSGTNIRRKGEDINKGDIVLSKSRVLKPQDLGLAASVGCQTLDIYRKFKVAIFSTGDELKEPGEKLGQGQIYNSNRYTLSNLLKAVGCEVVDLGIVKDTLQETKKAMQRAAEKADLVMTSGGVSVGEEDHIRKALSDLGELQMWRINIKPGKPLAFGHITHNQNNTPFIGLPGNPVSVFATFNILARAFILKSQGVEKTEISSFKVPSGFSTKREEKRLEYVRAKIERHQNGEQFLKLYPNQSSGVLTSVSWADGFAIIPANKKINQGDLVDFIPFSEFATS